MDRFIGAMLDNRYELLEVIGVGGTAVVYKAKCHRLNRYVAVKILKDEYAQDEEFRRQFHDEAQAVAMLSHPNIVNVYDVSRSGNVEYIVMELIDGITLKEYLSRRGRLTPKEVTVFTTQIARALEHAHSHDIIHRDIKPQNIMLLRDGTVKVADFGIAHFAAQESNFSKGEAIGSVHYVSPEQARGSFVDNRTDLYSLGVVMYEMITGRLPFEGDTPVSIALQHINSIALPPSVFAEDVPPRLEEITMKAMNPALSKRYASASQILEDLEAFQNQEQFKINVDKPEITFAEDGSAAEDIDATRKIQNTGEVMSLIESEEPLPAQQKDGELAAESANSGRRRQRSPIPGALVFGLIAILIFCGGAWYFIRSIVDPYGDSGQSGRVKAPDLRGLYYAQIVADPNYSDFIIEEGEYVYNEAIDAGKIISQEPGANHRIEKGSTIIVTISRGAKTFQLPNYVGGDARQAKIELERFGVICIEDTPEYNDEVPAGSVIRMVPETGTVITAGDTVTITVSKGSEHLKAVVPNLKGKTEGEALALLEAAGLSWDTPTYVEQEGTPGLVVGQSVAADSEVDAGTVIHYQLRKEILPPEPKLVTRNYTVTLSQSDAPVAVQVLLDVNMVYSATHNSSDGTVTITLEALEGDHTIYVYQNGVLSVREIITF